MAMTLIAPDGITTLDVTVDRTGLEMFWSCPRRFWWGRRFAAHGGSYGGLEPIADADYRVFGKAVARMMEESIIWHHHQADPLAAILVASKVTNELLPTPPANDNWTQHLELTSLLQGMGVVWMARVLPILLQDFEIVDVESEMIATFGPLKVLVRPDLVLRRKADGALIYFEFKTTAWGPDATNTVKFDHSAQIQIGMKAIKQKYGRVDGAMVGFFYKGQVRQGVRTHPFCYGYVKNGVAKPTYSAGWTKTPVAEILLTYDLTMLDWLDKFTDDLWDKQFWSTGLLTESPWILDGIDQQATGLAWAMTQPKSSAFPQAFNQCHPQLGSSCDFVPLCHTPLVQPLVLFKPREPHHTEAPLPQPPTIPLETP